MVRWGVWLACAVVGTASVWAALPPNSTQSAKRGDKSMLEAAKQFLAALDTAQKAKALLPFESEERFNWFYVPRERAGITFKAMTEPQRTAALDLLKASLSVKGVKKVETIRALETVLRELEQGKGPARDPELYYFTVFGEPGEKATWAWRYEGHHISLQWTFLNGKVIAGTPQFLGSNPAEVRAEGPMKGTRVLGAEEDLARALLHALDEAQRKEALLSDKAPADILTNNQRQAAVQEDKGLAYGKMTKAQQKMLMDLIREHAGAQRDEIAKARIERLEKAGLEAVKFAWMGGLERGEPHYYRVQGPTFLIELDNTQNNANHVHIVWRDFKGDFGRDLLADHYKTIRIINKGVRQNLLKRP